MSTEKSKAGQKKNMSTTNGESKATPESKFTEESQNNLDSSENGQQYEAIENTPFAIVKHENTWKIIIGNMIASPYSFESIDAAKNYVKEKHWELLWTMMVWVINNQEKFKLEIKK